MRTLTRKIPLTRGLAAVIDVADAPLVEKYKWHAFRSGKSFYAATRLKDNRAKVIFMHRLITGALPGCNVRFLNFNTLDVRRKNLQVTPQLPSAPQGGGQ